MRIVSVLLILALVLIVGLDVAWVARRERH